MQHTSPHQGGDLDFSLLAMGIVMTVAIVFLAVQLL
jgi:hypothetical protein